MGQLEEKTVIITGASSGIGQSMAETFAQEGARVVLAARSQRKLDEVAGRIRSRGGAALAVPTDVTDEAQVADLFRKTLEGFGRLDILVNNAGIFEAAPLEEMSLDTWRRVMDTNLTGPFLCTREAMRIMKPQGGGRIINIGSISAAMPRPYAAPYSCAKLALVALTKTTALEGRDFNVVASCLHPGNVRTPQMDDMPDEPMMPVEEIVKAALIMAALPLTVNMLEATVVPVAQPFLGRG